MGYINEKGKTILEPIYDYIYDEVDPLYNLFWSPSKLTKVKKDNKYGYIDKSYKLVLDTIFDDKENPIQDVNLIRF